MGGARQVKCTSPLTESMEKANNHSVADLHVQEGGGGYLGNLGFPFLAKTKARPKELKTFGAASLI